MKNPNYIVCVVSVLSFFNIAGRMFDDEWFTKQGEWAKKKGRETVYSPAMHAQAIALVFYEDKELASRYVQHAQFYAKKTERDWVTDNLIDHAVYPLVDHAVGMGMAKINIVQPVHAITDNISDKERKFIANNAQLILTAGVIKVGRNMLEGRRALDLDGKQFGKECAAQVSCDAADKYIVQPVVKSYVGNDDSLKAMALRFAMNFVISSVIIDQVNKM